MLLLIQRVSNTPHMPAVILEADEKLATGCLAYATINFNNPSGEERWLLNTSVSPSGYLSRWSRSALLGSCKVCHGSESKAECGEWVVSPTPTITSPMDSGRRK